MDRLPSGTLANGAEGIKEAIHSFADARRSDIENERLPPDLVDASEVSRKSLKSPWLDLKAPSGRGNGRI